MSTATLPRTAVLLCGGRGVRAWPLTSDVPKPMLVVGDRPALGHLVEIFARQGVQRLVFATGYKSEIVADWAGAEEREVELVVRDTGEDSGTGERLRRCADLVGDSFFATYGDGLGNVDLAALWEGHEGSGALATLTTVPLPSQYGTLDLGEGDRVVGFREKPVLRDHWINAGFFVLSRSLFEDWPGPDLERDVLPALAERGQLRAHRHDGFWKSMDTQKDVADLHALATEGGSPWLDLPTRASS